jgi:hypothetical protein
MSVISGSVKYMDVTSMRGMMEKRNAVGACVTMEPRSRRIILSNPPARGFLSVGLLTVLLLPLFMVGLTELKYVKD